MGVHVIINDECLLNGSRKSMWPVRVDGDFPSKSGGGKWYQENHGSRKLFIHSPNLNPL